MPTALPLLAELRRRADLLDYGIETDVTDDMGRHWRYHTYPVRRGGSHGYTDSKAELMRYIEQVEQVQNAVDEPNDG